MNKAVPWNINGVGFDAREAAREAARRQGKSLGEWLHAVIADHASELGVETDDVVDQDRIDAVTAKLERLSGRTADFNRPTGRDMPEAPSRERSPRRSIGVEDEIPLFRRPARAHDAVDRGDGRRRRPMIEEADFLLDEAIDAMERRAKRSERRTDDALASFAKLLETTEARRDREREAVLDLSQKLSNIEAKLTGQPDSEAEPIKGALARLEARLDMIGQRSAAETVTRQQATMPLAEDRADNEPIRRLEDKLNTILDAVAARPLDPRIQGTQIQEWSANAVPLDNGRAIANRRLGEAIAEISRRQRTLDDPNSLANGSLAPSDGPRARPVLFRKPEPEAPWHQSLSAMQAEIGSLATKIEDMRRDVVGTREKAPIGGGALDGLRAEIGSMSQTLRELAPRGTVTQLQGSIDTLMRRVETSRDQGVRETVLRPVESVIDDLRDSLADIDPRPTIGLLEREVRAISEKVDSLSGAHTPAVTRLQDQMQEIRDLLVSAAARPLAVEHIEQQVSALAERVSQVARQPSSGHDLGPAAEDIRAMIADLPGINALDKIEVRLEGLAQKLDDVIAARPSPRSDVGGLERLMLDLGQKIQAAQAPSSDDRAIEALQRQVELLSARFERSADGLEALTSLQRSMQDLFANLEQTRATVETSAAEAARETLRIAIAEGRRQTDSVAAPDVAALKALQKDADARTKSTLNAVHQTLEHVVGRMSAMESDLARVKNTPSSPSLDKPAIKSDAAPPKSARPTASDLALGALDPLFDPLFSQGRSKPTPDAARSKAPRSEEEKGRADFIAAARRAAQAAQSDPSVVALRQPPAPADADARAGLMAKSRDYVATHKRPVLLGVAAVFVVLGTMAIVQRMTFGGSDDTRIAITDAPASITQLADSSASSGRDRIAGVSATTSDLTPSALPKGARALSAQIPGSDPIQTGSIQGNSATSLPAFAAQPAISSQSRPTLSAGLIAMADAGNTTAEYELASRYADGKIVPRDLKLAAKWYEKASDQGLAPAQYRLAALYEKGLGVAQDKDRAKVLYQRAADAGNPRAMHNLAVLLADGDGKPDYAGAVIWFRKAAQYGVHDSQYNLAILLARGLGAEQSLVQSYQWFAIAATQNDSDAAKKRDEVGDKLNANDLAVAKALAASFQPRAISPAATDVTPPPGGWDSLGAASHINSARSKISSL